MVENKKNMLLGKNREWKTGKYFNKDDEIEKKNKCKIME